MARDSKRRRDMTMTVFDVLSILSEGNCNSTQIQLKTNLSYQNLKKIFSRLLERELILKNNQHGDIPTLTTKGFQLLNNMRAVSELLWNKEERVIISTRW